MSVQGLQPASPSELLLIPLALPVELQRCQNSVLHREADVVPNRFPEMQFDAGAGKRKSLGKSARLFRSVQPVLNLAVLSTFLQPNCSSGASW